MRGSKILSGALWAVLALPALAGDAHLRPPVVTEVSDATQRAQIIEDLDNDLRQLGSAARIERCPLVLDYVQPAPSGRDTSWGAVCSITIGAERRTFIACGDRMVGKFTLSRNFSQSPEAVTRFIERNCPPGG
jgi:hypothetical protein